ncbi:MAG: DUF4143 domain-containing protein [bacterium]|nr:DUF4143 domain-containing protein [bacterium]MBU1917480.1 DUF4143 domain-containing protein [bacterium]
MLNIKTLNQQGIPRQDMEIKCPVKMIERTQVRFIIQRMRGVHIEWISGPKRSGKTTALFQVIQKLTSDGVNPSHIIYVNASWFADHPVLQDPLLFKENLRATFGRGDRLYIIFDEVDTLKDAISFLQKLYDASGLLKLVAVSSRVPENLPATFRETKIFPINLVEWANHHESFLPWVRKNLYPLTGRDFVKQLEAFDRRYGMLLKESFYELALFGGYPEVLFLAREDRWQKLEEIFNKNFQADYLEAEGVDKSVLYRDLLKNVAYKVGDLINYSELHDLLKASHVTVKKYHSFLAKNYLIHSLPPLTGRKASEIKHAQKSFFYDCGFLNLIAGFKSSHIFSVSYPVITNMICSELLKNLNYKSHAYFWQTNTGTRVDFVVEAGKNYFVPIEVKSGEARPKKLTRSFHSFIKTYKPGRAIFANTSLIDYYKVGDTEVLYLPYYWVPILEGLWQ